MFSSYLCSKLDSKQVDAYNKQTAPSIITLSQNLHTSRKIIQILKCCLVNYSCI